MPLSDESILLLREIYDATIAPETIVAQNGMSLSPYPIWTSTSLERRLQAAIDQIDRSQAAVDRVTEILSKYKELELDPSNIDRDGYSLRYKKSVRVLRRALYSYTGIWAESESNNQIRLG